MGLDMYVRFGAKKTEEESREESYEARYEALKAREKARELCYWRKHPNLHGYIVEKFGGGVDECQEIPLTQEDVWTTLLASEADALPHTEGFFFGTSVPEDKEDTKAQLLALLEWMKRNPTERVYYQASW